MRLERLVPWLAAAGLSAALPAQAITGATPTTAFNAVGVGVQVTADWVLTVQHNALAVGGTYSNGYGTRTVAQVYQAPGSGLFPANDLALMRLAPAATSAPLLAVNGDAFGPGAFAPIAVTIASAANSGPARGYAATTVSESLLTYDDDGDGPLAAVTVNWLVSWDPVVYVQVGDSGSGLFSGHVTDSSMLWGLTSAVFTDENNVPTGSAFVQPGAYRGWIDAVMAADTADGQLIQWASAVPEPGTLLLWVLGAGMVAGRARRAAR